MTFIKIKVISSSHRVMFCLLYSLQAKNCEISRSKANCHMIDIFTSEDMENISLCISQYLTLYYIIKKNISSSYNNNNNIFFTINLNRKITGRQFFCRPDMMIGRQSGRQLPMPT